MCDIYTRRNVGHVTYKCGEVERLRRWILRNFPGEKKEEHANMKISSIVPNMYYYNKDTLCTH